MADGDRDRGLARLRGDETELIPLRVGQDEPLDVALADVGVARAESEQAFELLADRRVPGLDVKVQAVLDRLRVRDGLEEDARPCAVGS